MLTIVDGYMLDTNETSLEHLVRSGLPVWEAYRAELLDQELEYAADELSFIAAMIATAPFNDIEQLLETQTRCEWLLTLMRHSQLSNDAYNVVRVQLARYLSAGRARHELAIQTIQTIAGEHC